MNKRVVILTVSEAEWGRIAAFVLTVAVACSLYKKSIAISTEATHSSIVSRAAENRFWTQTLRPTTSVVAFTISAQRSIGIPHLTSRG
jgi:hypothetical protein